MADKLEQIRNKVLVAVCQGFRTFYGHHETTCVCGHALSMVPRQYGSGVDPNIIGIANGNFPELQGKFLKVEAKTEKKDPIYWYICKDRCGKEYTEQMHLAIEEEKLLQKIELAKMVKLVVDRLERESVERAMVALAKDIKDDKKEERA